MVLYLHNSEFAGYFVEFNKQLHNTLNSTKEMLFLSSRLIKIKAFVPYSTGRTYFHSILFSPYYTYMQKYKINTNKRTIYHNYVRFIPGM